jgi:hypothetical protein
MRLAYDVARCTGETESGFRCVMKNNCLRYLARFHDEKDPNLPSRGLPFTNAPGCIEKTALECPLKLTAKVYDPNEKM